MFRIITDTSSNLPTDYLRQNNVAVIPFSYYINGKEYSCVDTEGFDGKKFYKAMRLGAKISTSQINPQSYIDFFRPILESGEDILFVSMSSGISGSFHSAQMAKDELLADFSGREILLLDTLGASLGEGIFVQKAIEMRDRGRSLSTTHATLGKLVKKMYQVFTVDDLNYLKNTGRLTGSAAVVGNMLQIKPLLKGNEDGQIVNFSKAIGRKRSIEMMAQKYNMLVEKPEEQTVGIAHADCVEDAQYLISLLNKKKPPKDILTVEYEPVTGSHVGPGTLALFFFGDDSVRFK
ncbi:MAG: DegV family protein [Ruminococcus sp.]|nr:DegV family protein [Ruminococcus sp.]